MIPLAHLTVIVLMVAAFPNQNAVYSCFVSKSALAVYFSHLCFAASFYKYFCTDGRTIAFSVSD
jgi:hypothetical protein